MKKLSNTFALTCFCFILFSCGSRTTTSAPSDFVDGVATALQNGGNVDLTAFEWSREPAAYSIDGHRASCPAAGLPPVGQGTIKKSTGTLLVQDLKASGIIWV